MKLANLKLLTIICEPVLLPRVVELSRQHGSTGFTVFDVSGEGQGKKSSGEIPDAKSKIEIIVEPTIAIKLMSAVAERYFENYSLIAYLSDISVLRPEKFENQKPSEKK